MLHNAVYLDENAFGGLGHRSLPASADRQILYSFILKHGRKKIFDPESKEQHTILEVILNPDFFPRLWDEKIWPDLAKFGREYRKKINTMQQGELTGGIISREDTSWDEPYGGRSDLVDEIRRIKDRSDFPDPTFGGSKGTLPVKAKSVDEIFNKWNTRLASASAEKVAERFLRKKLLF
jgi:hypothetical protein